MFYDLGFNTKQIYHITGIDRTNTIGLDKSKQKFTIPSNAHSIYTLSRIMLSDKNLERKWTAQELGTISGIPDITNALRIMTKMGLTNTERTEYPKYWLTTLAVRTMAFTYTDYTKFMNSGYRNR